MCASSRIRRIRNGEENIKVINERQNDKYTNRNNAASAGIKEKAVEEMAEIM